ncbi:MAG: IS66 family transposase [Bacteroidales bacterium]|jgi:transposase|nr:IS66 family transposase [Bacteroidales bacterium]
MPNAAVQLETLDASILNYIKELESAYNQRLNELEASLNNMRYDYAVLEEKYELAVYKRFMRSAEKLLSDSKQQFLFTSEEDSVKQSKSNNEDYEEVKSFKRKKRGRKALDSKLPRRERIIDIAETEKTCACGVALTRIGEESNEKLHIIPQKVFVEKTIRPKYACRGCEGTGDEDKPAVRIAPVEPSIIPRGIASASLLSTIITQKFEYHLPYYRQEKQFEHIGVSISRQDMSSWQQYAHKRIKPLLELMRIEIRSGPLIQMDETTVQVMGEEGRTYDQKSYMWVSRGGLPDKPVVLYEYRQTRAAYNAKDLLLGYSGYLQTDGYEGYDAAVKNMPGIVHVGCFAHARRKFFEAAKVTSKSTLAEEGIQYIKKLYDIESKLRKRYEHDEDKKKFCRVRQLFAWRPLKEFKEWLLRTKDDVPPSLLLGKAVGYTLSQWDKLVRYLERPYLTPDNNTCENAVRPFVLGRKNWLFCQSPDGADSSCGMYSLIQTAKKNGLNPQLYLTTLFDRAPYASSKDDWLELLPWNISKLDFYRKLLPGNEV